MSHAEPADIELDSLIGLFFQDTSDLGEFTEIPESEVPQPDRSLLAHNQHMTVTVEQHHDSLVDVVVQKALEEGDTYSRKILLKRQSDSGVVQFGIVRLNLAVLDVDVRAEIVSQSTPLGRILIEHDVMRQVKLQNLYHIRAGNELAEAFGIDRGNECFGRTALIYCNGRPAVELLEIVSS